MRCRQARRRMILPEAAADRSLREHVASCPACAEHWAALARLDRAIDQAAEADRLDLTPLPQQRKLVEARAARLGRAVAAPVRLRPARRLRWGAAALAVAVLLLLTVVPFSYQRTLGYKVSICCVEADLALEGDTICDLFYHLGLDEANYDVLGCDSTCKLMIVDLRSREEVEQVVEALRELTPQANATSVIPVTSSESASLLHRALRRDS